MPGETGTNNYAFFAAHEQANRAGGSGHQKSVSSETSSHDARAWVSGKIGSLFRTVESGIKAGISPKEATIATKLFQNIQNKIHSKPQDLTKSVEQKEAPTPQPSAGSSKKFTLG